MNGTGCSGRFDAAASIWRHNVPGVCVLPEPAFPTSRSRSVRTTYSKELGGTTDGRPLAHAGSAVQGVLGAHELGALPDVQCEVDGMLELGLISVEETQRAGPRCREREGSADRGGRRWGMAASTVLGL